MQSAKLLVLCVSLLWFQNPTQKPEKTVSEYVWYQSSIQALRQLCGCHIELHPDYEALPVSLTGGNFLEFLIAEKACGVLDVNHAQTKGMLFLSRDCRALYSLPGIRRLDELQPDSRKDLYAFWSY